MFLTGTGCNTPAGSAGAPELYHHNWWNFYEHGRALAKQGRSADAALDFERCLGLRSGAKFGYDRDAWRARTYGLHVVDDFFPNRELGVCYFELGRNNEAIKLLETSLSQEPSGRAKHYLNLARRKVVAASGTPAPVIAIAPAARTSWTRERTRLMTGEAASEGFVSRVAVNGRPAFVELAAKRLPFTESIALKSGTNVVTVEAVDLAGKQTKQTCVWVADWQPPEFAITGVRDENGSLIVLGNCTDDRSLQNVSVSGVPLLQPAGDAHPTVSFPVTLTLRAHETAMVVAEDAAGNRLQTVVSADSLRGEIGRLSGSPGDRVAEYASVGQSDVPTPGATVGEDHLKPTVQLSCGSGIVEAFDEEFFLDGNASDGGGLASIAINGENLLASQNRGAHRSYFSRRLQLDPGTNRFDIAAQDLSGNVRTVSFTVIRRTPEYLDDEYRLSIGIPPVVSKERVELSPIVARQMETEILRPPVRFHILERDEGWDYVLREQGLSQSELADPKAILKIGKMVPAEMLLMSNLLPAGKGMTVYCKVVETGNGQLLFSEDVYAEGDDNDLGYQVGGLILKVKQHFPLVAGQVTSVDGGKVTIDVGSARGIRSGTKFVVVKPGGDPKSMAAGRICKHEGRPVELAVNRVKSDTGVAEVLPATASGTVKEGDYVHSK